MQYSSEDEGGRAGEERRPCGYGTLSPKRETSSRSQRGRGRDEGGVRGKEEDRRDDGDGDRQHNNHERVLLSLDSFVNPGSLSLSLFVYHSLSLSLFIIYNQLRGRPVFS